MKQFFTWMTSKRALPFPIFLYSLRVIFQFRSHIWDGTNRFCTHTEKGNAVYVSLWYLHLLWLPRLDQNCCRPHLKLNNLNLWLLDKTDIHGHMEREHLWKIFEIAKNHNSVCNGYWVICHYWVISQTNFIWILGRLILVNQFWYQFQEGKFLSISSNINFRTTKTDWSLIQNTSTGWVFCLLTCELLSLVFTNSIRGQERKNCRRGTSNTAWTTASTPLWWWRLKSNASAPQSTKGWHCSASNM